MTNVSEKVLDKIKQSHLEPLPKWHFLLKHSVIWVLFAVSVILGSLSFSLATEAVYHGDWDIHVHAGKSAIEFFWILLPLSWLTSLIVFSFVAYYNWRHTRHGYRTNTPYIFALSVGISAIAGFVLCMAGFGATLDAAVLKTLPAYRQAKKDAYEKIWYHPEKGLLSGTVTMVGNDGVVLVEDARGKQWVVCAHDWQLKSAGAKSEGAEINIVGKKTAGDKNEFLARDIRPSRAASSGNESGICPACGKNKSDLEGRDGVEAERERLTQAAAGCGSKLGESKDSGINEDTGKD